MRLQHTQIKKETRSQVLYYEDSPVLKYSITYPQFFSHEYPWSVQLMNLYYRNQAVRYEQYVRGALYKSAIETYLFNEQNGYPQTQFEALHEFTVTYNQNCLASLYSTQYEFTGGAHGNTVQSSETWNLSSGQRIPLARLFPHNPDFTQTIIRTINQQIRRQMQAGSNQYFDDYRKRVHDTFQKDQFYLTSGGIAIYFQQYDIAPYSSGIPTFILPYRQIGAVLPDCSVAPVPPRPQPPGPGPRPPVPPVPPRPQPPGPGPRPPVPPRPQPPGPGPRPPVPPRPLRYPYQQ